LPAFILAASYQVFCGIRINYHFVRIPRYRKKVLTGSVHKRLKEIFEEIAAELGFENLAL
jgi:REP element-mobilizing transposase RayT